MEKWKEKLLHYYILSSSSSSTFIQLYSLIPNFSRAARKRSKGTLNMTFPTFFYPPTVT